LEVEKWVVLGWQGDLINRLIHRSWGEDFVNIFLDLFHMARTSRFTVLHFTGIEELCCPEMVFPQPARAGKPAGGGP
jgi:hypothetical protein